MIAIAFFDASNGTKRQIIAHLMPMPTTTAITAPVSATRIASTATAATTILTAISSVLPSAIATDSWNYARPSNRRRKQMLTFIDQILLIKK